MAGIRIQGHWVRSSPPFLYNLDNTWPFREPIQSAAVDQRREHSGRKRIEKSDIHVSLVLQKNCKKIAKKLLQKFAESLKERVAARKIKKFFFVELQFLWHRHRSEKKSLWAGFAAWGHLLINLKTLFSELEKRAWGKRAKPEKGDYQPLKSKLWINYWPF